MQKEKAEDLRVLLKSYTKNIYDIYIWNKREREYNLEKHVGIFFFRYGIVIIHANKILSLFFWFFFFYMEFLKNLLKSRHYIYIYWCEVANTQVCCWIYSAEWNFTPIKGENFLKRKTRKSHTNIIYKVCLLDHLIKFLGFWVFISL